MNEISRVWRDAKKHEREWNKFVLSERKRLGK
jgi:hypothetical protein